MFHLIIKFGGMDLIAKLAHRPEIGQTVRLKANGRIIETIYDGMGLFPKDMPASTAKIVVPLPMELPAPEPAAIPAWAFESDDPRIQYLAETSENGDDFQAKLYGSAWKDALLMKGDAAPEETELGLRWAQLDAKHARKQRRPAARAKDIHNAVKSPRLGRKDEAGKYLEALGQDDPVTPEDAVVFAQDTVDMDKQSDFLTTDAERSGDWGVERPHVHWDMDVIEELIAHTGKVRRCDAGKVAEQPQYPLSSVIVTLVAKRRAGQFSEKQEAFIERLLGRAGSFETEEPRKNAVGKTMMCPVRHNIVNKLWNNIQALEWDIDYALDEYEIRQAEWDEMAHPRKTEEPRVEVSVERQATFLDYVAKKAKSGEKPWLSHPSYLAVLDAAFQGGARTPRDAHNRAYAADTLRLADRITDYDPVQGFTVRLNGKGQTANVSRDDARVAYPHLPKAAQARMKALAQK